MFRRYFSYLTVAVLCALMLVRANYAHAETLEQAMSAALTNHPNVEAALANRDAFIQEQKEKYAGYFPRLNVRGAGGRTFSDNSTSRGVQVTRDSAYSYLWEGSATLTQPIFDGFETVNRVDAARARRNSANHKIVDVREEIARSTAISYLDVMKGREVVSLMAGHYEKLGSYIEKITKMVDQGAADESLLVRARDIRAQLGSARTDVKANVAAAEAAYFDLVGHMPPGEMFLPQPQVDMIPETMPAAIQYAREKHPSLLSAQAKEHAFAADAEAESQFYYPDLNGELSYLKRDQREEIGGELVDAKAVVRLNWDLSLAGAELARKRKAMMRHEESRAQKQALMREIEREVRVSFSDLFKAQEKLGILRKRVENNKTLFKNYEAQFEGGAIDLVQLMQSDNALFNTEIALLNGKYAVLASQYNVLASLGRLQESMKLAAVQMDDSTNGQ